MEKLTILQEAMQDIDTSLHNPTPEVNKLDIPTKEEIDNLENNNPTKVFTLTLLHPVLHVVHQNFSVKCGMRTLALSLRAPMYGLRNVRVGCMMHPPSRIILNNCHSSQSIVGVEMWARIQKVI